MFVSSRCVALGGILVTLLFALSASAEPPPTSSPVIDIHSAASRPVPTASRPTPPPSKAKVTKPKVAKPKEKTPAKPLPPPEVRALRRHPGIGKRLFIGGGFSLGFFWPKDVNSYLEGFVDSLGVTKTESGTSNMLLNFVPRLAVAWNFGRYLQLAALGEIGWAPKVLTVTNGESELFSFTRFSGGLILSANLPLSVLRGDALFLGLGALIHHLDFEDYSATAPGARISAGYRFYEGSLLIDAFVAFDYARAGSGKAIGFGRSEELILNFTGVLVGATAYFGVL